MGYVFETFTVELSRDYASESMGTSKVIGQHALDEVLTLAAERGNVVHSIVAGPDYILVVLRRGNAEPE